MQLMDSKASDRVNRKLYESDYLQVTNHVTSICQTTYVDFFIKKFLKIIWVGDANRSLLLLLLFCWMV